MQHGWISWMRSQRKSCGSTSIRLVLESEANLRILQVIPMFHPATVYGGPSVVAEQQARNCCSEQRYGAKAAQVSPAPCGGVEWRAGIVLPKPSAPSPWVPQLSLSLHCFTRTPQVAQRQRKRLRRDARALCPRVGARASSADLNR